MIVSDKFYYNFSVVPGKTNSNSSVYPNRVLPSPILAKDVTYLTKVKPRTVMVPLFAGCEMVEINIYSPTI